ncbi:MULTISPECIES: hypothetical protein [unclassified Cellulosimicrobium]|uniref:hypothetical protein n=1 Tax=unclassified Cellulosimicrobium TaxID=2624466 RepID=UPI001E4D2443|nr:MULTISPECIES: hypothetical protein [unclassified Cellulosimicrobium]
MLRRRAVVVHRRTELDDLLDRHGTRGQAEFFLRSRGRSLAEVQARHDALAAARDAVVAALPRAGRAPTSSGRTCRGSSSRPRTWWWS